jgi:hypothetical protein
MQEAEKWATDQNDDAQEEASDHTADMRVVGAAGAGVGAGIGVAASARDVLGGLGCEAALGEAKGSSSSSLPSRSGSEDDDCGGWDAAS